MGLITEIDFTKLEPIAEKHKLSVKTIFNIWQEVHAISEQVITENAPLEKLRIVRDDINEFITLIDSVRKFNPELEGNTVGPIATIKP